MPRRTNVKHAGTLQVRAQGPGDGGWTQDTVWNAPEASELNDVTSTLPALSKDLGEPTRVPGSNIMFQCSKLKSNMPRGRGFLTERKTEGTLFRPFLDESYISFKDPQRDHLFYKAFLDDSSLH